MAHEHCTIFREPTAALLFALGEGKVTVEDLERYGKKR
jgi:hypothetical protein